MIPTITTQQIQIFLAVTDAGGFAKAAPLLFMTQSAVSKAVSRLEQQLGFPLFERTIIGMVLLMFVTTKCKGKQ